MAKKPYMPFYIGDWKKDPEAQSLDLEHKGLLLELLFTMWECEERGKLLINNQVFHSKNARKMFGISSKKYQKMTEKLVKCGALSIDEETGCLMSRRIVKDEKIKVIRSDSGKKGGNPSLKKNLLDEDLVKQNLSNGDNQNPDNDIDNDIEVKSLTKKEDWKIEKQEAFEKRWKEYPGTSDGRKAAQRSWNASIKTHKDIEKYDVALDNYLEKIRRERNNGFKNKQLKIGSTWFNNWKDWIPGEAPPPTEAMEPPVPLAQRVPGAPELESLWSSALERIKAKIGPEWFEQWFSGTYPHHRENGTLTIAVPSQITRKCLIENYQGLIESNLELVSGEPILVDFYIDSTVYAGEEPVNY